MVKLTVRWSDQADLVKMKIQVGKKTILDDLISRVSLKEISEFFGETLENAETFNDRKSGETTLIGDIGDEDLQELYEYFEIEPIF